MKRPAAINRDELGIRLYSGYESGSRGAYCILNLKSVEDVYEILAVCNEFIEKYEHENCSEEDGL